MEREKDVGKPSSLSHIPQARRPSPYLSPRFPSFLLALSLSLSPHPFFHPSPPPFPESFQAHDTQHQPGTHAPRPQMQAALRQQKASLAQKLLDGAKQQPGPQAGRIVNDFGQEEAGVSKRQQKQQVSMPMAQGSLPWIRTHTHTHTHARTHTCPLSFTLWTSPQLPYPREAAASEEAPGISSCARWCMDPRSYPVVRNPLSRPSRTCMRPAPLARTLHTSKG
jgi:hypothetical protein